MIQIKEVIKIILAKLCILLLFMPGCTGMPVGIEAVGNVEIKRYLGKWHEIAILDHSFERGLSSVSAEYSMRDGGGIRITNRGYDANKKAWKEAEGKAYFIGKAGSGRLKVSFFGPFYGAYNIIDLDEADYSYSLVCGYNKDYLWILARTPDLNEKTRAMLVEKAAKLGFATDKLIYPGKGP